MKKPSYRALVAHVDSDGSCSRTVQTLSTDDLPDHDLLIRVHYSSLNYKDALSASGDRRVTPRYPHTPGIDAAGLVEESADPMFKRGDPVIVTSYGLGEDTPGGFGEYIRVPPSWAIPLPDGLSLSESMILGTAGLTASIGLHKLEQMGLTPGPDRTVLITGATGGVGSLGVALFSDAGYKVVAATGKKQHHALLYRLGAEQVIDRRDLEADPDNHLNTAQWDGALDTVGGTMLDAVLRRIKRNGSVACCGNILGKRFETSIYPFILRGINLLGIDSGRYPRDRRIQRWQELADTRKPNNLQQLSREVSLGELDVEIKKILRGGQTGRILVNLNRLDY